MTDAAGTIVAGYAYEAFGRLRSATGTLTNDVRFTGERTDPEVGLLFLRARHYDPDTGRFLQADRWPYDERNSQDLHRYAYVRNDPLNAVDPSGHIAFLAVAFAALTVVDVVTSFAELARDPNPGTAAMAAASLMPGSWAVKAVSWAVKGARAAVAGIKAGIQIARGTRVVERTTRAVSGAAGWVGARISDAWGALFRRAPGAQKPQSVPPSPARPTGTGAGNQILPKRAVADPKLRNYVDDLYKGTTNPNRVGTGTTADAVRHELATGQPVAGQWHIQKAEDIA